MRKAFTKLAILIFAIAVSTNLMAQNNYLGVGSGSTLTVSSNTFLVTENIFNEGTISVSGTLTNNGVSSTFTNNGTFTDNGTVTLEDLTNNSGKTVDISEGKQMTIEGDLDNDGTFTINSSASGTGSLIVEGTVSGNVNVEQYITGTNSVSIPDGRFWYLSSPISNATSAVFNASGNNRLWYFTESSGNYTEISDNSTALTVGKGYVARVTENSTLNFSGSLNIGEKTINTTWNSGSNYPGFNLVGNPYQSAIDWEGGSATNLRTTYWNRTKSAGGIMVHDSYNTSSQTGTNNNGNGAIGKYIPSMQAFWVRCKDNNASGSIVFDNSDRSHQTETLYKNGTTNNNTLRLRAERGVYTDETIIYFFSNASVGFDEFDTEKMFTEDINLPQIYTTDPVVGDLVMQSFPFNIANLSIPMGFETKLADTFALNAYNILDLNLGISVYLEDLVENTIVDLRQNPMYNFSSNISNSFRFIVHFYSTITNQENICNKKQEANIYSYGNSIYLQTPSEKYSVKVFDIQGKLIVEKQINNTTFSKIEMNNSNGYYIVKLINSKSVSTKKVFINHL